MNLFSASPSSSSSPTSTFTLITPSQNPNPPTKFHYLTLPTLKTRPILPPLSSNQSPSPPILQETPQAGPDGETSNSSLDNNTLVARRPVMEISGGEDEKEHDDEGEDVDNKSAYPSPIDESLSKFAKKMPIFEPDRVQFSSGEKPLMVNLDLALYRAKVLARKFQYAEAEEILQKCISYWPEDGRAYVALGKILSKQSKTAEARAVYETGCQATQGENAYIWQCWAVLENRTGNIRRARELFDAATVADKKHIAAWHGWAVMELKQGNVTKARDLLGKALKFCGGNEYVYQTLALLEARASRFEQARYLFKQATRSNPKSCASWLAWAQLEMQLENNRAARGLFEKAIQASPKNRFAWHVWGVFEADMGNIELGRKLLKVGHTVNPRDPVLLQSLALLEYKHSTANLSRALFRKASELDPRHQPVWIAWGWMEWKEGNLATARELYQRALSINSSSESAARCLQAWGVLEQRVGNLSAARRLLRSSLNVNSQSYVTWMTWASLEEDQGNSERAEEIRELYFQQRTEVVDDASWVTGFLDVIDPAVDSIKRFLNFDESPINKGSVFPRRMSGSSDDDGEEPAVALPGYVNGSNVESGFNLDAFIREKLLLDPTNLDIQLEASGNPIQKRTTPGRKVWRPSATSSTS